MERRRHDLFRWLAGTFAAEAAAALDAARRRLERRRPRYLTRRWASGSGVGSRARTIWRTSFGAAGNVVAPRRM